MQGTSWSNTQMSVHLLGLIWKESGTEEVNDPHTRGVEELGEPWYFANPVPKFVRNNINFNR